MFSLTSSLPTLCSSAGTTRTEDFSGSALNIPDYKVVVEAMKRDYDGATTEEKNDMTFFLNTVMPCVDPEVTHKYGSQEGKTHLVIFDDCWHSEMATGLLVLKEYSRADNLIHNVTLNSTGGEAKKKKHKRLHTKIDREKQFNYYYSLCNEMNDLRKQHGFECRMECWDKECFGNNNNSSRLKKGPGDRADIVPYGVGKQDDSSFLDFMKDRSAFLYIFRSVSELTPTSDDSKLPPLTGHITQLYFSA
jgi:hypothetical protein